MWKISKWLVMISIACVAIGGHRNHGCWAGPTPCWSWEIWLAQHGPWILTSMFLFTSFGHHHRQNKQDHGLKQQLSEDATKAPCGSVGYTDLHGSNRGTAVRHQHGHRLWPRIWASVWPLVSPWAMDINTYPGCGRTTVPDMVLTSMPGSDVTMASCGSSGNSSQPQSCCRVPLRPQLNYMWGPQSASTQSLWCTRSPWQKLRVVHCLIF